jgi:hypothetical protein
MMSEQPNSPNDPNWLDEFEEMANQRLEHGSSCEQVHPIVERWYTELMQGEPPESRDSVQQAMACLTSEILSDTPDEMIEGMLEVVGEDELAGWIEYILLVGRAFEMSLRDGKLDDL